MTTVDQSLLNAIRVVVGEAVAPLSEKIDGLTERVDGLTERVDGLTERVDGLTERVDGLSQRMDDFSERLRSVEIRLTSIEDRVGRLEEIVERLDTRTGQISQDLFELQQHVDRGFDMLKSETTLALKDIDTIKKNQHADRKKIRKLENQVANLQQRLSALEQAQAAQAQ